ncbi:MAG: hypothetical protein EXQ92_11285 [Alphaproteobacteria bacterium]|nr:hypothetical protein [Alphaproteobacteria bacterium]
MSAVALPSGTLAGRLVALAVAGALAVAIWIGLAAPRFDAIQSARQHLERQHQVLQGHEQAASRADALAARLAALTADPNTGGVWLAAGSEAQAMATMQDRVKTVAASVGATVVTAQPLGAAAGAPARARLRVGLSADTTALQATLHALESGSPLLLVETLTIRPRSSAGGGILDVQIDLAGFIKGAAP